MPSWSWQLLAYLIAREACEFCARLQYHDKSTSKTTPFGSLHSKTQWLSLPSLHSTPLWKAHYVLENVVSDGEFIKSLNRGIEGRVKGYFEDNEGCLLYLSRDDTIYVPAMYIERRRQELLDLLRDAIREGVTGALAVAASKDALHLQPSLDARLPGLKE